MQGNSGAVSCGDPEDRRRVLDTSGGSRVCSGLAAVSSCVRQGLLPPTVAVGLAVVAAKVGGLGFRPLGHGVGDLPLGRIPWGTGKWGPKGGSRYPEGRRSMGKGAGARPGPGCGVDGKAVGAGNGDTPGAGGTVEKGNLGAKRGSSGSKAGAGAMGGKVGAGQGSRPGPLARAGYWSRGGGTGGGGSLGLGSSGRRKSEFRKALESRGPGQLLRACRRLCPERWLTPDEAGGTSEPKTPLLKKGSAMGPKPGGSGKCEAVGVGGGR